MQRREINVFSMSFLDLLSSALAAVIILFIIVPKTDVQTQIADESIAELKTQFVEIDSILIALSKNMSPEEIQTIMSSASTMKEVIFKLEEATLTIKNRLQETKQQNEELRLRLNDVEKRLRNYAKEEEEARAKSEKTPSKKAPITKKEETIAKTESSPEPTESASAAASSSSQEKTTTEVSGKGDFMFGLNPAFAVMLTWEDTKATVDLYLGHEGRFCDSQNRSTSFGRFVKMPKRFVTTPNQAIIQKEIKPGVYEIYAHLYRPRNGTATINGFVAINPPDKNPKKIDFGPIDLSSTPPPYKNGGGVLLGTVELSDADVKFKRSY